MTRITPLELMKLASDAIISLEANDVLHSQTIPSAVERLGQVLVNGVDVGSGFASALQGEARSGIDSLDPLQIGNNLLATQESNESKLEWCSQVFDAAEKLCRGK